VQAARAGVRFADFLRGVRLPNGGARLWYSPYLRTKDTAAGLIEGMGNKSDVFRDMRRHIFLTEQRFGLFDGLDDAERAAKFPVEFADFQKWAENGGKFYARNPQGESRYDVCLRVHSFFGTIIRDAEKPSAPVPSAFIVSHGTTIRAFAMMWLHKDPEWFDAEKNPNNCSIRWLARDKKGGWMDNGYIFDGYPDQDALRKIAAEKQQNII
jgi:2,3-bisphosphoglycerate-dependent phosphoglycerate mutase